MYENHSRARTAAIQSALVDALDCAPLKRACGIAARQTSPGAGGSWTAQCLWRRGARLLAVRAHPCEVRACPRVWFVLVQSRRVWWGRARAVTDGPSRCVEGAYEGCAVRDCAAEVCTLCGENVLLLPLPALFALVDRVAATLTTMLCWINNEVVGSLLTGQGAQLSRWVVRHNQFRHWCHLHAAFCLASCHCMASLDVSDNPRHETLQMA